MALIFVFVGCIEFHLKRCRKMFCEKITWAKGEGDESDSYIQGALQTEREARQVEMSVPNPKQKKVGEMWSPSCLSLWIGSSALIHYFLLCLFICMPCFLFRKCCSYRRLKFIPPWKIYCIEAWKVTSCFRKCATWALLQGSLLLPSCYC